MSWAELHDAAAGLVGRIGLVYHAPTTSDLVALGRYVERVTAAYAALCPREIDVGAETRVACPPTVALHADVLEHLASSSYPRPGREDEYNAALAVVLRGIGRPVP